MKLPRDNGLISDQYYKTNIITTWKQKLKILTCVLLWLIRTLNCIFSYRLLVLTNKLNQSFSQPERRTRVHTPVFERGSSGNIHIWTRALDHTSQVWTLRFLLDRSAPRDESIQMSWWIQKTNFSCQCLNTSLGKKLCVLPVQILHSLKKISPRSDMVNRFPTGD